MSKELNTDEARKAEGRGRRLVIEETDGEESSEAEEIEVKPSSSSSVAAAPRPSNTANEEKIKDTKCTPP